MHILFKFYFFKKMLLVSKITETTYITKITNYTINILNCVLKSESLIYFYKFSELY